MKGKEGYCSGLKRAIAATLKRCRSGLFIRGGLRDRDTWERKGKHALGKRTTPSQKKGCRRGRGRVIKGLSGGRSVGKEVPKEP